jgi:hypothetical protein
LADELLLLLGDRHRIIARRATLLLQECSHPLGVLLLIPLYFPIVQSCQGEKTATQILSVALNGASPLLPRQELVTLKAS